jgi:hypothetical protein
LQVLAKYVQQKFAGLDRQFVPAAIHAEFNEFFFHERLCQLPDSFRPLHPNRTDVR